MTDTTEYKGYSIRIEQDENASSPDENGNEDLFLVTTRNNSFEVLRDDFDVTSIKEHRQGYHILPLFAYVHSGVSLSLGNTAYPFNDQWDSGQIGFVLVQKRAGFRNIRKAAESLVDEWNQYLSGDVWGFIVEDEGVNVDSCWGIYGGMYAIAEAKVSIDGLAKDRTTLERMERSCFAL